MLFSTRKAHGAKSLGALTLMCALSACVQGDRPSAGSKPSPDPAATAFVANSAGDRPVPDGSPHTAGEDEAQSGRSASQSPDDASQVSGSEADSTAPGIETSSREADSGNDAGPEGDRSSWTQVYCGEDGANLRETLVCTKPEIAKRNSEFVSMLADIADEYPDSDKTRIAAMKQVNACKTRKCLLDAYESWSAYLEENYPYQLMVD